MTGDGAERGPGVDVVADVRDAIAAIPKGSVATYGDIGARIGLGPRHVGNLMGALGDDVAWWRVVRATGAAATCHGGTAWQLLLEDGVATRGSRVDLDRARVGPSFRTADASLSELTRRRVGSETASARPC